jgi:hypothetical protein
MSMRAHQFFPFLTNHQILAAFTAGLVAANCDKYDGSWGRCIGTETRDCLDKCEPEWEDYWCYIDCPGDAVRTCRDMDC